MAFNTQTACDRMKLIQSFKEPNTGTSSYFNVIEIHQTPSAGGNEAPRIVTAWVAFAES